MKKSVLAAAFVLAIITSISAVAANDAKSLTARLAKESTPENVKAVALRQKKMSCLQNAKNKKLQNEQKENYLSVCMNKNEAQMAYSNFGYMRIASAETSKKKTD